MKQVPQILDKGISGSYTSEFAWIHTAFLIYEREGDDQHLLFKKKILRYEEKYPSDEYLDVITDENRETVKRMDTLADRLTELLTTKSRDKKEYQVVFDELISLIYTEDRTIPW